MKFVAEAKEFERIAFTLPLAMTCPRMDVINMSHLTPKVPSQCD